MEKITTAVLKEWEACDEGLERFTELFPDGVELKTAVWMLIDDKHSEWAAWLYEQCRNDERFKGQTLGGFANTGCNNTGNCNTGDCNSGNANSGNWNSGYGNSGSHNSGDWNSGSDNSGEGNSGNANSGGVNSGFFNSGYRNSGNWNSGRHNAGDFNSTTPDEILVFNKPMKTALWQAVEKPGFFYKIKPTRWLVHDRMDEYQKAENPEAAELGGILIKRTYHEAWRAAWDDASIEDRRLVPQLPNFDPDVFLEITGIDVRKELS